MKSHQISIMFRFCLLQMLLLANGVPVNAAETAWPGVDESVVEKYAEQYGRPAKPPLVNTDQGDLLLFVFLLAGAAGGFLAGYSWRSLMLKPTSVQHQDKNQQQIGKG